MGSQRFVNNGRVASRSGLRHSNDFGPREPTDKSQQHVFLMEARKYGRKRQNILLACRIETCGWVHMAATLGVKNAKSTNVNFYL